MRSKTYILTEDLQRRILAKSAREEFPVKDENFKIKFKGKIHDMKINNKDCIMLTQLYEKHQFVENDEIIITDGKKGIVELIVKSTAS